MNSAQAIAKTDLKERMFEAQAGLCWICGELMILTGKQVPDAATFDHIIAVSHGGTWDESNLKLAHKLCNNRRGNGEPRKHKPNRTGYSGAPPFTYAWLRARGYITR